MFKVKVNLVGNKQAKQFEVSSRAQLLNKIQQAFNIDQTTVTIMKPQIKDQETFKKNVKDDVGIIFKGTLKKQLTKEEQEKIREQKQKQAKAIQDAKKWFKEININAHQRIIEKLIKMDIKQRGFSYMNQNGEIEKLNTDHYTSPLHLMRIVPQFKKFCIQYKVQPKNPDGLLIEELGKTFKMISGETQKLIDPLDWCSSFIAYCADDIDYPYPTYDFNYIITKIFSSIQNAHITEAERRQPNATPSNLGQGNSPFAVQVNLKKTKITKLDEDDFEAGKEMDKKELRYVLQCDLSDPSITSFEQGIKKRFEEKIIWQSFYAFDLEYKEKIINIERPAKYLFVHINRIGYPPAKDESEEIVLLPTPKSTHKVRTKRILDLSDLSSNSFRDRLENGKFERYQLFYRLADQEGYLSFIEKLKEKSQSMNIQKQYSDSQLKYMYFDDKLLHYEIFHEYYFDQLKGSKQTGEYRIIGVVYHKGKYYHHPDSSHKVATHGHDKSECRGEFMVMVYKQGKQWLKFHDAEIERVDLDEVLHEKYWGGGEWTPVLCLYREIYIKNIQIQIPQDD